MSELPRGWAETTLGEITEGRISQEGPDPICDSFCYVDISSIDRATKRITNPQQLPASEAPSRARQRLEPGDVVVSMTRPNLNAVALIPEDLAESIGSTGFHVLRSHHVLAPWISYRVQTPDFVSAMSMKVQGALYPAVRPNDIAQFTTAISPREEQARIVAEIEKQFSRLDAATEALKRIRANLKRYRASVLKAACEGRLVSTEAELARKEGREYEPADQLLERILRERRARWEADTLARMTASGKPPKDDRWKQKYKEPSAPDTTGLPTLPKGWCWARAEQVCDFITKGTTPSAQKLFDGAGEIPFIKVYNLTHRGKLDFAVNPTFIERTTHDCELARSRVFPGDVLMNIVGPPLGKVSIVPDDNPEWNINQAIAIFRPVPGLQRQFLATLLMTDDVLRWAMSKAKATAGQFNLTLEICRDLPIPLPPVSEQQRIAEALAKEVGQIQRSGDCVKKQLRRGESFRRALLASAFSGKLVPQDPDDEPASILLERIRAERAVEPIRDKQRKRRAAPELIGVG